MRHLRWSNTAALISRAGHTLSWGLGLPRLLTPCYTNGLPDGTFGPIDPTQAATYDTVGALLGEVAAAFPDAYMHIGGDEVREGWCYRGGGSHSSC